MMLCFCLRVVQVLICPVLLRRGEKLLKKLLWSLNNMSKKATYDHLLLFITLVLTGIGALMVYSSSAIIAFEGNNDSFFFFKKQLSFICLGFISMIIIMHFDYNHFRKLTIPLLMLSLLMLIVVLIPGLGL